jgi:outer membrane lipoprotein-sorting protein
MIKRTAVALAVLALAAAHAVPAAAQTVNELVEKHLASRGGAAKWKSIQTQTMTGVATVQGMELPIIMYAKRPNLVRQELALELPGQPAVVLVSVFDGARAWSINPLTGSTAAQEVTGAEADATRDQADFDGSLIDYEAKGHTVELVGRVMVGGKQAHHLKVTRKNQPVQHYYLDPDTFVELKVATEGAMASQTELSDYRPVDGILVPHFIRVIADGMVRADVRVDKIEFNPTLADSLFRIR